MVNCRICSSNNTCSFNTYKHIVYMCNDCNSVFHLNNKKKYFLEYLFPSKLSKKILPLKAFARLYHLSQDDLSREKFYNIYVGQLEKLDPARISEVEELKDTFKIAGIDIQNKKILDISGAPGFIVNLLKKDNEIEFTELNSDVVNYISKKTNTKGYQYDYFKGDLTKIVQNNYDIVLIRSSIIFCPDLDKFVSEISNIIANKGTVLVQTILPSCGEIFVWQQSEYKFPRIYSQSIIESIFYKYGFKKAFNLRINGNYTGIKWRGNKNSLSKLIFTFLIDLPMAFIYRYLNFFNDCPIDNSMDHKMLTQIWKLDKDKKENNNFIDIKNLRDSKKYSSIHFSRIYNGFLKNLIK